MRLEAHPVNCFTRQYLLKLEGRPIGQFGRRWFSEGVEIRLTERLQLNFEKQSWLGSDFRLLDANTNEVLASGERAGFFTGTWNLKLRSGTAQLVRTGMFSSGYQVIQDEQIVSRVSRINWYSRGWQVEEHGSLDATDLIFIGLVYHTILQRKQSSQNANT